MAAKAVKLASLRADTKKETEGDLIMLSGFDDLYAGILVRVRSSNYAPFRVARDAEQRRLVKRYGSGAVPDSEIAEINGRLAVTHLLLDWEGLDVPFDRQTALSTLTDDGYRDLRNAIFWAASQVGKATAEYVEEAAGN